MYISYFLATLSLLIFCPMCKCYLYHIFTNTIANNILRSIIFMSLPRCVWGAAVPYFANTHKFDQHHHQHHHHHNYHHHHYHHQTLFSFQFICTDTICFLFCFISYLVYLIRENYLWKKLLTWFMIFRNNLRQYQVDMSVRVLNTFYLFITKL